MLQLNLVVNINAKDFYMYKYIHVYTFHIIPCYFIIFIDLTYDSCHICFAYVFLFLVILLMFVATAGMVDYIHTCYLNVMFLYTLLSVKCIIIIV